VRLVRIGLDLGHAGHVAVPLGEQRQQRLVDAVELGADVFLAGAVGGRFAHGMARERRDGLLLVCTDRAAFSTLRGGAKKATLRPHNYDGLGRLVDA
jgi:hypothetical protein